MTAVRVGDPVPAAWTAGPPLPYPDRPLPDLVAAHARHRPDAVAVAQWDERVTYRELVGAASALAGDLADRGVGPDTLVGVCAGRRPPLIAALLGVLASGAGYVPLDPALPPARLRAIAAEAGLRTVVCDPAGTDLLTGTGLSAGTGITPVPVPRWTVAAAEPRPCPADASGAAYAMFTSGSTGRPKGVLVPHGALTEFVTNLAATTGLDAGCRALGFASIGFDASVIDLLTPLATGGTIALVDGPDRADPARLARFCAAHRVTMAFLPPALLPLLDPAALPDLRVVLTGAEAPGPEQVARWTAAGRRFFNLFGPTEGTVLVTLFEASGAWDRPLPIGRPAPNHRVYVVDADLCPVRVGEPGELLAGGPGLALGYLNDPALTSQRFVPDPFSGVPGDRLYRTGDLVSWQPDGTLAFLGRADRQVKIRGQRVEIGEIEAALRGHPAVGHAAVLTVPDADGAPELVAFVTPVHPTADPADATAEPDAIVVRQHLADRLPAAMVPARVRVIAALPLTNSGKVDLDRLVAADRTVHNGGAVPSSGSGDAEPAMPAPSGEPPATAEEEHLAAIWARLLDRPTVHRDDDFFAHGGHSITAMRLVAAVRDTLGRDLSIEDVLAGRTLRAIAARAAAAPPVDTTPPVRGRPPELSPAMQRLWFLDRYVPEAAAAYNVGFAERLRGPLDVPALEAALAAVAERHEVLRWRIPEVDGVPHAVADPPGAVPLPVVDVPDGPLSRALGADVARRFALDADRLWRATLYRIAPEDHVLAVTAHHAVFDGWSLVPFYDDLAAAYAAAHAGRPARLPALPATYGDYVAWRADRATRRGDDDLRWWVSHLDGVPTILELPADRPRPAEQTFAAGHAAYRLDAGTTAAVARLARELGTTASAVLLAALGVVAARLSGGDDLVIGAPAVDRRDAAFESMVGFFIDIAPLRLRVDGNASFAAHVAGARDELLAALAHPAAPLDRVVQDLGLGGRLDRGPLVQVLFNMFTFAAPELRLLGLSSEPVPVPVPGSPFDLTVYGIERAGQLAVEAVYNADLFDADRMAALLEAVTAVVYQGVAAPDTAVRDLALAPGSAPAGETAVLDACGRPAAVGELGEVARRCDNGWQPTGALGRHRPDGTVVPALAAADVPRARARPAAAAGSGDPPSTPTERVIAGVWCEVLGRSAVGVTDSFFDSGGGSLAIVVVQRRLSRLLGRELRVVDLFRYPTVRALASHVDGAGEGGDAAVERAARRGAARRDRGRRRVPHPGGA